MSEEQFWRRPLELELEKFRAFGEDCKAIIEKAKEQKLRVKNVEITDNVVRFDCFETFYVDRVLDLRHWENPYGTDVPVKRFIISNDPNYKYPDLRVVVGEGASAKDYYLQTVRTNWEDNRIVVIACLVAFKHRFPEVWVDSDTIDHERDVIEEATKLAGKCIEARNVTFANEKDYYKNPFYVFESLKKDLMTYIRLELRKDGDKLNKIVQDARRSGKPFYTNDFMEIAAKKFGYTNIGEIDNLVDAEDGSGSSVVKTLMMRKTQDNGTEISLGFDAKGRLVGAVEKLQ